jgi:PAS domain S-box-containing protein
MSEMINILLIEDNKADAKLIEIYLKESFPNSFTLAVADYLQNGLKMIKGNFFDIIIIDLSLPDSSGLDTFKSVHAVAPEKPIIVLTGMEDELIGINTVKLGAQDFLIKGALSSKSLKRSIDYSIERYKLLHSLAENAEMLEEKTEDLLNEKQKLAQAQKLAHIGSWEWDLKDNSFSCSEELARILKLDSAGQKITYEEFIGCIHPEDRENVTVEINKSIAKQQSFDFLHRVVRKDGTIRFLQTKGELIFDKEANISKIIGTEQDVTQKKREEQLEQLAMVAIKSYNAVTIADKDGKIEWVNEGFTKLFGFKLKDVKGTYGEVLRKGERTGLSPELEYYSLLIKEKRPLSYENKNYSKDGAEFWVLTSLTPLLNEKGEVEKIISIDSDITKQKRAEQELIIANKIAERSLYKGSKALEELHKAKKEVEESLKVKEQFLANMSHEIRTPMNAIIGFTNLLLKADMAYENKQYLNAIKTSGENLLVIINDILDFSKLESGKITIESIPFKISQLLSTVIDLMLPKAIEKNIKLSFSIGKNVPEVLLGDPTRLNQILINLVGNAIKFTKVGGVKINILLNSETDEDVSLHFSVTDTGIGIPNESIGKIFEGFTQATNDTTRKYGGTGLGLTITKQLVELQGGTISVNSTVGKGSTFIFRLTFKKSAMKNQVSLDGEKTPQTKFPLEKLKVLLVEDNLFNQMLAAKILENWHCIVETAENGLIAIEKIENANFDLILMDIQLPEMDGYQATSYIRNKIPAPKSNIPIIAMTAHAFAEEVDKCLKYGMDDYISKPFDENKLQEKIIKVLRKKDRFKFNVIKKEPVKHEDENETSWDLTFLERASKGDTKFVLKMISVFLKQTPELLNSMKISIETNNKKLLKKVIHRMMPSVIFMGMKEMDEILTQLDIHSEDEKFPKQLETLYKKAELICRKAIKDLEAEKMKLEK